jgi:hypothetical protein
MAKGAQAQDLLQYTQWKDVGAQLDRFLSKRVEYFPKAARWLDITWMQFKLAALFCVAKCDMWTDGLDASPINSAKFLMTTSAQWAGNEQEFWVDTDEVREKLSS